MIGTLLLGKAQYKYLLIIQVQEVAFINSSVFYWLKLRHVAPSMQGDGTAWGS